MSPECRAALACLGILGQSAHSTSTRVAPGDLDSVNSRFPGFCTLLTELWKSSAQVRRGGPSPSSRPLSWILPPSPRLRWE